MGFSDLVDIGYNGAWSVLCSHPFHEALLSEGYHSENSVGGFGHGEFLVGFGVDNGGILMVRHGRDIIAVQIDMPFFFDPFKFQKKHEKFPFLVVFSVF